MLSGEGNGLEHVKMSFETELYIRQCHELTFTPYV